jgi:hypothetical protein
MSSSNYLSMKERNPESGTPDRWTPTPVRTPDRCDHVTRVCSECWRIWNQDWMIRFRSTTAGRLMIDRLGLTREQVETAAR